MAVNTEKSEKNRMTKIDL